MAKNEEADLRSLRSIQRKLRILIDEAGLTDSEVAEAAGVSPGSVAEWFPSPKRKENKKGNMPAAPGLVRVAQRLGTTAEELLGLKPPVPAPRSVRLEVREALARVRQAIDDIEDEFRAERG